MGDQETVAEVANEVKTVADGTVIVTREELDLVAFAGKEEYCFPVLHVTPERTEATNGHIAVTLKHGTIPPEDWPESAQVAGAIPSAGVQIATGDVKRLVKGADSRKGYGAIPILRCAKVGATEAVATDLSSVTRVLAQPEARSFPRLDVVIPDASDDKVEVCLNAHNLKALADYAIKHGAGNPTVRFWIAREEGTATMCLRVEVPLTDSRSVVGGLMPCRWES